MYAFDQGRVLRNSAGGWSRIKVEITRFRRSLSSSGSNQAREGRLVDALAVRGDEGRDTLR